MRYPFFLLILLIVFLARLSARAQSDNPNFIRTAPYPAYRDTERQRYNLKWGKATGRFRGSILTEYNDNINLAQRGGEGDLIFQPIVGVGFLLPLSKVNIVQLDMDMGYRSFLSHRELDSFTITPDSRLDYRVIIKDVVLSFHDLFSIQADPVSRPELSGESAGVADFRRLNNVAGVVADWRFIKQMGVVAGYDYTIDRALSAAFETLDRNDHTLSGGGYYILSPRWTIGLNTAYSLTEYVEKVQNDSRSLSLGPFVTFKPSAFITIDAMVGYSEAVFSQSGTIADQSDFQGLTFQVAARHRITSRTSQNLRLGRGAQHGVGSNFTDTYVVQHDLATRLTRAITLSTGVTYENFTASAADEGDRVLLSVGTAYKVLKNWSLAVNYAFALRDSSEEGRNYTQNRFGLMMTRNF